MSKPIHDKLENPESTASYRLILFLGGNSVRCDQAVEAIQRICEVHLQGDYQLETIDVRQNPERVREYQVLAVPTLIRQSPTPAKRIVGDLSAEKDVLAALDISPEP